MKIPEIAPRWSLIIALVVAALCGVVIASPWQWLDFTAIVIQWVLVYVQVVYGLVPARRRLKAIKRQLAALEGTWHETI